jgi:hypothetical protein
MGETESATALSFHHSAARLNEMHLPENASSAMASARDLLANEIRVLRLDTLAPNEKLQDFNRHE